MYHTRKSYLFGLLLLVPVLLSANPQVASNKKGIFLPNQWTLRPAGTSIPVGDLPISITVSPDGKYAAVVHAGYGKHEVRVFDLDTHQEKGQAVSMKNAWLGCAFTPDGKQLYVSAGMDDAILCCDFKDGVLSTSSEINLRQESTSPANPDKTKPSENAGPSGDTPGKMSLPKMYYPSGIAIDSKGQYAYVACQYGNCLLQVDLKKPKNNIVTLTQFSDSHAYPYKVVLHPNGKIAYVSLWGGKSVAVVDLEKGTYRLIPTDAHPNELILTEDDSRLYVACANSNGVNIIDTKSNKVIEKLSGSLYPNMPAGSTPNGLALSHDEKTLYVANADNNNLAVFDVEKKGDTRPLGFIPTGWYPTGVAIAPNGDVVVINGKGNGSMANPEGPYFSKWGRRSEYIGGILLGSVSFIPQPDETQLKEYSKQAYLCSPLREDLLPVGYEKGNPIPEKVGDPSPIKYVVYIIKENRTYDQVLGDVKEGNGDPNLCIFGEKVTPNLHKIVKDFVLYDNFYCDAEVSADGHEWSMGAYATDFVEKTWPSLYGGHSRGDRKLEYKSEGTDPVDNADAGHLWNRAKEAGITYRSYGEWVAEGGPEGNGHARDSVLEGHINPYYAGFNLNISDFDRATVFLNDLAMFEKNDSMPRLTIMRLPNDHTSGTTRGKKTPTAYVAENDVAMGIIVEALSHSKFWKQMAIFVIEDDAQNGSDHVDAHRTEAIAISPYLKRGYVDHHIYSTTSMLRTIELILGLQPMSQFDAAALPMYASFTSQPDFEPYTKETARVSTTEINGPRAPMQRQSSLLNFQREDANPDVLFNEIIWKSVRGEHSEMPAPVRAAFVKPSPKPDDRSED